MDSVTQQFDGEKKKKQKTAFKHATNRSCKTSSDLYHKIHVNVFEHFEPAASLCREEQGIIPLFYF